MKRESTLWKLFTSGEGNKSHLLHLRRRRGFTLVEVIVVLVIIAILAAIAIPALTGYIDKADDNKYISDARNFFAAVRTALAEAYAYGTLGSTAASADMLLNGNSSHSSSTIKTLRVYVLGSLDYPDDPHFYDKKALKLIGGKEESRDGICFVAPRSSPESIQNASAFIFYVYFAETGGPDLAVTFQLDGFGSDIKTWQDIVAKLHSGDVTCNSDVGYKVFRLSN